MRTRCTPVTTVAHACSCADSAFTLDCYDVVSAMAYPPDDAQYDGVLITGSRASVCVSRPSRLDRALQGPRPTATSRGSTRWWRTSSASSPRSRPSSYSVRPGSQTVTVTLHRPRLTSYQASALATRSSRVRSAAHACPTNAVGRSP